MANNFDYEDAGRSLNDTKVDNIDQVPTGPIDQLPALGIDISDAQLIKNLNNRIEDSDGYWNTADGFNLEKVRSDNVRAYQNRNNDVRSLYRYQLPYKENQIYIAEQAIKSYLTSEEPEPNVSPASDSDISKIFAMDFEHGLMAFAKKVNIQKLFEDAVGFAMNKRVGYLEFEFDPNKGEHGEICVTAPDPDYITVDKNAPQGENPAFYSKNLKMTVNEVCNRWPEKKQEIYDACGIVSDIPEQLETILNVRKVYMTYYDKQFEAHEGLVYYTSNVVFEKSKNPHWLYANEKQNYFDSPRKPLIALNFDNDGTHWIDNTSAIEQALPVQMVLNKRGRQLMEVADKANGILIVSQDSGLTKDDLQELTGDPNQRLIIKTNQQRTADMVYQVPPPEVPNFLYQDKTDLRMQVGNLMGAPTDFSGADDGDGGEDTLGQSTMKKDQSTGRQDLYVRAIHRLGTDFYEMVTQLMVVWYSKKHTLVYDAGDGEYDHLTIYRDLIEKGITVSCNPIHPYDKKRLEAVALKLLGIGDGGISLLDAYKMLHLPNPQKLYDNLAKAKADPMSLARDVMDDVDESKAYVAYKQIMVGENPPDPDDCTKEFVLSLRKLMLKDDFINSKRKHQKTFLKYVDKAITSLELRTSLDIMSQKSLDLLKPNVPIQPLPPPTPPPTPGMPGPGNGMMPPGMPGQPPNALGGQPGNPLGGLPAPTGPPMPQGPMGPMQPSGPPPLPPGPQM